jgi:hypothetical protein
MAVTDVGQDRMTGGRIDWRAMIAAIYRWDDSTRRFVADACSSLNGALAVMGDLGLHRRLTLNFFLKAGKRLNQALDEVDVAGHVTCNGFQQ